MSSIPTIQVGDGKQIKPVTPVLIVAIGPDGNLIAVKADVDGKIKTA